MDGTPIYVPSASGVSFENDNIVSPDSGRVESGKMHITWIRRTQRKIELTYERLTGAEKDLMHNLMQGREFTFTYFDNGIKVIQAYAGKDSYTQKNLGVHQSEGGLYENYKINVIEM